MTELCKWVECTQSSTQSALTQDMSTMVTKSEGISVPIKQTIVDLLTTIMEHTDDLKGSSIHMWPSHYKKFSTFITKMSDKDWEILLIVDPRSFKE